MDAIARNRNVDFAASGQRPRLGAKCFIGQDRGGTLMRHFRSSPLAIATLALGMREAAPARSLVTPTGLAAGMTPRGLRAPLTSVDFAPVAVAADHYLAATTGAVKQACAALHRALLPMRAGLEPKRGRYSRVGRALHGLGARHRGDCGG